MLGIRAMIEDRKHILKILSEDNMSSKSNVQIQFTHFNGKLSIISRGVKLSTNIMCQLFTFTLSVTPRVCVVAHHCQHPHGFFSFHKHDSISNTFFSIGDLCGIYFVFDPRVQVGGTQ